MINILQLASAHVHLESCHRMLHDCGNNSDPRFALTNPEVFSYLCTQSIFNCDKIAYAMQRACRMGA